MVVRALQRKASIRVSEGSLSLSAASDFLNSHQGNHRGPGAVALGVDPAEAERIEPTRSEVGEHHVVPGAEGDVQAPVRLHRRVPRSVLTLYTACTMQPIHSVAQPERAGV
jgi:hypothetical protein